MRTLFILLFLLPVLALSQTGGAVLSASLTRPANSTPYAAQDVVKDTTTGFKCLTFYNASVNNGGAFIIRHAVLVIDTNNVTSGSYDLYLFRDTLSTAADNAAFALTSTQAANNYLGKISFTLATAGTGSTTSFATATPLLEGTPKATSKNIYGVLVATGTHTPKLNGKYYLQLAIEYY